MQDNTKLYIRQREIQTIFKSITWYFKTSDAIIHKGSILTNLE